MGRQVRIPPQYATVGTVGFVAGWFSRGALTLGRRVAIAAGVAVVGGLSTKLMHH